MLGIITAFAWVLGIPYVEEIFSNIKGN